ncbi:MAG TPA: pyruvate, phosphate dikinase [Mycobacteriales bacterium]|nr:pyruvate, phosphate dikinase [Mycobacteriales bacterium]
MAMVWLGETEELSRERVGGKAFGINRMLHMGLPVPPAFTLTCDECLRFHDGGEVLPRDVVDLLATGVAQLEHATGRRFGDAERPLLVSVRSGAARSMPGMMDTVLNLGMTPQVQAGLARLSGDSSYAEDTARRFSEQYEKIVGTPPPADPIAQLHGAVGAVFSSWFSERATAYRAHHDVDDGGGTSVTVQAMVFGNLDDDSGTGVLFSRNPLTGEPTPYGEWLPRGQGEDVVSGRFDALPLSALEAQHPAVHDQLLSVAALLEREAHDVQDIEYTVESGRLYLLQTRAAKRSPEAAVRIAVDLHDEGVLSEDEALAHVTPGHVRALMKPHIAPDARATAHLLARGEPACPGVASGRVVTDVEQAEDLHDDGVPVVLARPTTDPDDVSGMIVSAAIVTEIGGATSHAAVVSRELGTPCVVGCGTGTVARLAGREVTVDGSTGEVFEGLLPVAASGEHATPHLDRLAQWARARAPQVDGPLPAVLAAVQAGGEDGGARVSDAPPALAAT